MMNNLISPDTNLALIQAAQSQNVSTPKTKNMAKIDEAAQDFEAVFVAEMMKPMFEGTEPEAPFGGGKGEEVFRGMMLQEYGKIIAQTGGIGIARFVKDEMIRIQSDNPNVIDNTQDNTNLTNTESDIIEGEIIR